MKASRILILAVLLIGMVGMGAAELFNPEGAGTQEWTYTEHTSFVYGVAVDSDGYVYSASRDDEVHKIDSKGNNVWEYTENTNIVHGVAVDSDGYVYSANVDDEVHKIDSDGNNVWEYTEHTNTVYGVAVDSDGYVYSASGDDEVHKIDSDGNNVWEYTKHTNDVFGVAVDNNGNVYSASTDEEVHKIDSDGNNVWEYTEHTDNVNEVAVDNNGNVYSASRDEEVHKIDSDGNQVWTYTGYTDEVESVAVDNDSNVYSASRDGEVHKIDSDGNQVWKYTGHSGRVEDVAVDNDGNVYSAGGFDDEEVHKLSFNQPPEFQDVSTSPDPPVIDTSSDVSFEASDDNEVSEVEVEWFRDGTLQESQTNSYSSSSVEDTITDFYTPTEQGEHTIYFTATDDEGASTTETLEYTEIEEVDFDGQIDLISPDDQASFEFGSGPGFEWSVETGDTEADDIRLVVEDSTGVMVQEDSFGSLESNEVETFTEDLETDLTEIPDNYNWFVEVDFDSSQQTEVSGSRDFTVEEPPSPESTLEFPESGQDISFSSSYDFEWSTETFDVEAEDIRLVVEDSDGVTVQQESVGEQSSFETVNYDLEASTDVTENSGSYTWFIEHDYEGFTSESSSSSFTVGEPEFSITTLQPENVGVDSAELLGDVFFENPDSVEGFFEYRETGETELTTTSSQTVSDPGQFSEDVSDLAESTEYEYRAVAESDTTDLETGSFVHNSQSDWRNVRDSEDGFSFGATMDRRGELEDTLSFGFIDGEEFGKVSDNEITSTNDAITQLRFEDVNDGDANINDYSSGSPGFETFTGFLTKAEGVFGGQSVKLDTDNDIFGSPDFEGDFTVGAWVNFEELNSDNDVVFSNFDGDGTAETDFEEDQIASNNWHHLVVEREGDEWRVYQDGSEILSITSSSAEGFVLTADGDEPARLTLDLSEERSDDFFIGRFDSSNSVRDAPFKVDEFTAFDESLETNGIDNFKVISSSTGSTQDSFYRTEEFDPESGEELDWNNLNIDYSMPSGSEASITLISYDDSGSVIDDEVYNLDSSLSTDNFDLSQLNDGHSISYEIFMAVDPDDYPEETVSINSLETTYTYEGSETSEKVEGDFVTFTTSDVSPPQINSYDIVPSSITEEESFDAEFDVEDLNGEGIDQVNIDFVMPSGTQKTNVAEFYDEINVVDSFSRQDFEDTLPEGDDLFAEGEGTYELDMYVENDAGESVTQTETLEVEEVPPESPEITEYTFEDDSIRVNDSFELNVAFNDPNDEGFEDGGWDVEVFNEDDESVSVVATGIPEFEELFEDLESQSEVEFVLTEEEFNENILDDEGPLNEREGEFQFNLTVANNAGQLSSDSTSLSITEHGFIGNITSSLGQLWIDFKGSTGTTGQAFMGLVLMLVAGAIGFAAAGSIGAGFGMAAMFLVNTLVGLFPGWIVLALVIGGLAYVLIMRGD